MSKSKPTTKKAGKNTETEEEESNVEIISGISSAHSWIKALTFVRPKNLGREEEDSDDEEEGRDLKMKIRGKKDEGARKERMYESCRNWATARGRIGNQHKWK